MALAEICADLPKLPSICPLQGPLFLNASAPQGQEQPRQRMPQLDWERACPAGAGSLERQIHRSALFFLKFSCSPACCVQRSLIFWRSGAQARKYACAFCLNTLI